jgi:hypothetical protein
MGKSKGYTINVCRELFLQCPAHNHSRLTLSYCQNILYLDINKIKAHSRITILKVYLVKNPSVDVSILLQWILKKQDGRAWSAFLRVRIRTSGGFLRTH